jgi:outer membrane protein OmpA-like peptidoglycan-associated protein
MTHPFHHCVLALAIASLVAPLTADADGKGRWINDGLGRSTRDGQGSTCVASGGDTHAFANPDCDGQRDARKAKPAGAAGVESAASTSTVAGDAPAPIIVELRSPEPAATGAPLPPPTILDSSGKAVRSGVLRACVNDSRGSTGLDCDAKNMAGRTPAPAAPAVSAAGAAAQPSADSGAAAVGAATVGASAMADAEPFSNTEDSDDEGPTAVAAEDATDNEAVWLADGDGPEDDVLADRSGIAAAAVGESLSDDTVGAAAVEAAPEEQATGAASVASPAAEAPAEFPVTAYTADTQADSRPAPLLQRTLQMEKSALFDTNSAVLKRRTVPELDALATFLRKAGNYEMVTVTGHTDRLGSDALNQRLSEQRAKAVRDYLVTHGVDPTRIVSTGKGRSQPVTAAAACDRLKNKKALRACLAPDRRVEIEASATVTEAVKSN